MSNDDRDDDREDREDLTPLVISSDDGMVPNQVSWSSDSPFGALLALSCDELTRIENGTAISFDMADDVKHLFDLKLCGNPARHVHVGLDRRGALAQSSIAVVMAYTIALALDREDWVRPIPTPDTLEDAWEDVLTVIEDQHENFSDFLRENSHEGGFLDAPSNWMGKREGQPTERRTPNPNAN